MTGVVAWFTGLPSSGKTTLAGAVGNELKARGIKPVMLDSDDLRASITPPLGYDNGSRAALYGTLARIAALVANQGHIVLVPATAHRRVFRDAARSLAPQFVEIYVDTPLEECKRRDRKGTYAGAGELVPGVGVDYEPPVNPDFRAADTAARIAQRLADLAR
ncbi:MAG TPA: adenylyl-sulfate kinase [Kofleriaceae bacterium]|nr:adenylyl-sulfate kinase [Kofleriaceae bacterium]